MRCKGKLGPHTHIHTHVQTQSTWKEKKKKNLRSPRTTAMHNKIDLTLTRAAASNGEWEKRAAAESEIKFSSSSPEKDHPLCTFIIKKNRKERIDWQGSAHVIIDAGATALTAATKQQPEQQQKNVFPESNVIASSILKVKKKRWLHCTLSLLYSVCSRSQKAAGSWAAASPLSCEKTSYWLAIISFSIRV